MKNFVLELSSNPGVTLTAYLLDNSPEMPNIQRRPAVLVCPGGAYLTCSDREAEPVAMAFLAQGYHAFILRYSVQKNAAFPAPLRDAEAALETIRENADEWNVRADAIAACGFSAGGHLAAALGTMGRVRPDALILGYPAILSASGGILPYPIPSVEETVDANTPPAFVFTTGDDALVPVENSLRFAAALVAAKVSVELHIYASGAHGLSLARPMTSAGLRSMVDRDVASWLPMCAAWLERRFGAFPSDADSPAAYSRATAYGVDVLLEICWRNPNCRKIIQRHFPMLQEGAPIEAAMSATVRQINAYAKILSEEALDHLDAELRAVQFST